MVKILITGSSGFVGESTARHFSDMGCNVTGIDIRPGKYTTHVNDVRTVLPNSDVHYDVVFHFAAMVGGRANIETNYLQMMENVEIDRVVVEWANRHTSHLIYPSSSAIYPVDYQETVQTSVPLAERMVDFSTNTIGVSDHLYGWSKLCAERMLWEISKSTANMRISIFRPFSGYGPAQSLDYPFPNLVENVRKNPHRVEVWGTGEQERDFIHINDILLSFEKCVQNGSADYSVVNLGSGTGTSFVQLIKLISSTLYDVKDTEIVRLIDKPVGVQSRIACTKKQERMGLTATTTLIEGIETFEK